MKRDCVVEEITKEKKIDKEENRTSSVARW